MLLLVIFGVLAAPSVASAQQYIGAGAGLYTEDGDLTGEERRDVVREEDESFSFDSHSTLAGGIWYLRHASENVRWGGGLRYYGSYEIVEIPEEENNNDDEPQPFELGQLTDFYVQAEWLIPFGGDYALILGAQAGPSLLVPDGEFQDTIDELKEQGVDVWDSPRVGFNIAPQIGGRWEIDERLSLRGDLGVRYENLYLFAIDDNVEGVTYERSWTTSTLRYEFGLAMEIAL
ncbi:hypothetical protein FIV42_19200 [Persicimonas caeni]|uniref:Outer membrane protein beta-barrel domain-containing protein n=1 Tax=Persicimonas caeni TaxID=2292766 RepID=A0A4Y6PWS9_PERCE|nr:hypothetical protein [Persicimonas caeni]QDG52792.1 hypothetical protein FIV42_19200 [Persicimonas caeni]QED34014.1 hypothetical protein FRD00_19195 [Persicimonas caeni]